MISCLPYVSLALWPVLLSAVFRKHADDSTQKKRLLLLCFIGMVLFIGLRHYSMGSADSYHYHSMMQSAIDSSSWSSFYNPDGVEMGFQLFLWVLSRVCRDAQGLFIASGMIYASSALYVIWKEADNCVIAVVLYICLGPLLFELQGMRQAIAMSICMVAYLFAKKKKLLAFTLLVLLACSFHQTAVVFSIVYPICRMNYSLKNGMLLVLTGCLTVAFSLQIANLGNALFDREYTTVSSGSGFITLATYALFFVSQLLLVSKEIRESDPSLLYLAILNFLIYFMRYTGAHITERISFYFLFAAVLLFSNSLANLKGTNVFQRRTVMLLVSLASIALFVYHLYGSNLVPYVLCLN